MIRKGTGAGADFLGWRDLPENYDREEFDRILKAAEKIKKDTVCYIVPDIIFCLDGAFRRSVFKFTFPCGRFISYVF